MNYWIRFLLHTIFLSTIIQSAIIYVDSENDYSGSGTSWSNAYNQLQDALYRASSGDSLYLRGNRTYTPVSSDRDHCFIAPKSISIYGGFYGTETDPLSRPPPVEYDLYESIISGNIGNVNTN
eukprot:368828_1